MNTQNIIKEKEILSLRFHQELIIKKTLYLINKGNTSILWGCKCRSGKTYMIGGLIRNIYLIKTKLNVLIITPAPTETIEQFTSDLFNKFKDFNDFEIHYLNLLNNRKKNNKIFNITKNNNIFVMSKQMLQRYVNENTIQEIKNLNLDIIAFDENHFSGTTDISKNILESYINNDKTTIKIYLTATYSKPLKCWNIIDECRLTWTLEDELICKTIFKNGANLYKLMEKYDTKENKYIDETLKCFPKKSINDIFKPYATMPDLHIITNMFDQQKYNELIKNNNDGFSFNTLLSLDDNNQFNFNNEISIFLNYITNPEINKVNSIFKRIDDLCLLHNSRHSFTQLWFLPSNNINNISKNLKTLMMKNNILNKYNIVCINRKNNQLCKNIKEEIIKQEQFAKFNNMSGLIVLASCRIPIRVAGNMLGLGITIERCDIVFLMHNITSPDKIMQQMFRCMTEGPNKKIGIVIDLNVNRTINTITNIKINSSDDNNIENKIKYVIENNLINIDNDIFINKELNANKVIQRILNLWAIDPINSYTSILANLNNECNYYDYDDITKKIINNVFNGTINYNKSNKINFNENSDIINLPSGRNAIIISENNIDMINKKKMIVISFTKDVLPYIIPLICVLNINYNNNGLLPMINNIENSVELLNIFNDQSFIWWPRAVYPVVQPAFCPGASGWPNNNNNNNNNNNKYLINIIRDIIIKYFDKSDNTNNISIQFKILMNSLIDKPKELLELIASCLRPKDAEKKMCGEVFTPMEFINNKMLKDMESYWLTKYKENIWTNKNITFYDPAAGMGNYPIAIFYKLMDGLKNKIPNYINRKKHILEKQLYFGEINKKNCYIIKKIFNIDNKYKLNLYCGNTLEIDIKEKFNINKFDIIIGNPPYNEEFIGNSARPLYNKFIEYHIDKCDMLTFIVPSRWFAGGKGLNSFRSMMINRKDIVYINHISNASLIFGPLVRITGGVNYFLIDKTYHGLCKYITKNKNSYINLSKFDIILEHKYYSIVNKLKKYEKITKYYNGTSYYKIKSNDKRLTKYQTEYNILCYVSQQKGFIKFINKNEINQNINKYKVITVGANGHNDCFGHTFIGKPNEIHSQSYISFEVNNKKEAMSLLSYLKCKLPNFMLSLRKISQNISRDTCKWIPIVPINKNIVWTDALVYKYFNLTINDIKLIDETILVGYT